MQPQRDGIELRNLVIAFVLSALIMFVWQMAFPPQLPVETDAPSSQSQANVATPSQATASEPVAPVAVSEALTASPRVTITSDTLHGSIALKGLRFDDLRLVKYRDTISPDSPEVRLLAPSRSEHGYFAQLGFSLAGTSPVTLPGPDSLWQADRDTLSPGKPVTLSWSNDQGLTFVITVALDDRYLFTITRSIANTGAQAASLAPYALLNRRWDQSAHHKYAILHEGPFGVFHDELQEVPYSDFEDQSRFNFTTKQGWAGISDKYWFTAFIPSDEGEKNTSFQQFDRNNQMRYQVDMLEPVITLQPGERTETSLRFFAGPKEIKTLDRYAAEQNIPLFDRAVDFGVLYFLTKPIFLVLEYFYALIGNFGIAILLLTVLIKLLLFPLANKSYLAMGKMKELHPRMMEIRERYADDKIRQQQEMMELYKKEKVNPASGCLPLLVQIPVFFALYKVLFVTIEMRHAPFYGWIHDLSAPDPLNIFTLFGLIPWDPPSALHIGIWPLLMTATMAFQQRLNPKPADPVQEKIMKFLPYIFLFVFAAFPAGLVIYWTWNNSLSILQQMTITRLHRNKKKS